MSNPKLIETLRALLPYAISRIQDMDEAANIPGAHQATERELADQASAAYREAEVQLAEYDALRAGTPDGAALPRVCIKLEGGVVQNVFADSEASIYVIDYDVEDGEPPSGYENQDHAVCQLEQDGGGTAACILSRYAAELAPNWFPRMDAALEARAKELEEAQEREESPRP
jgi:hypothetical protein